MNRGQLRNEVALRLRIPPAGDPLLDEPTLNDMIRAALIDVSAVSDWPWLLTSTSLTFVAGVAAIPTNATKVRDIVINSRPAEYVGNSEFFLCQSVASRFVWTVLGVNIQLTPIPTVSPTNTLWYIQPEPSLTSDIMAPLLPLAHQQVLIARACYHAEVRRGRADAASFHNAEYERGAERMKEATHTRTGPRQIRTSSVGWYASW